MGNLKSVTLMMWFGFAVFEDRCRLRKGDGRMSAGREVGCGQGSVEEEVGCGQGSVEEEVGCGQGSVEEEGVVAEGEEVEGAGGGGEILTGEEDGEYFVVEGEAVFEVEDLGGEGGDVLPIGFQNRCPESFGFGFFVTVVPAAFCRPRIGDVSVYVCGHQQREPAVGFAGSGFRKFSVFFKCVYPFFQD